MKKISIWWIRRDLRLSDNEALNAAINQADYLIPLFILDEHLWQSPYVGAKRLAFLVEGLNQLHKMLSSRNSQLIIRSGKPEEIIPEIASEYQVAGIFAEEDFSPYAVRRDKKVSNLVPLQLMPGLTVHHPNSVLKNDGTPYTVFTPFSKAWKARPITKRPLTAPDQLPPLPEIASDPHPMLHNFPEISFHAGETEALKALDHFTTGENPLIYQYHTLRDIPGKQATSGLSPYLRFGMISARQAVHRAETLLASAPSKDAQKGAETWLNELIWREFFQSVLYHFPEVRQGSFRADLNNIHWSNDLNNFDDWCEGKTGYPIVDAAMRQLKHTGWMHNRARMIVASFLTKDLLIDWRWGEKWFMQHLVDGDPAANNGGWQWAAGTGTDAAPYFRIFNPILQAIKFDPSGEYVRRWVPELKSVPDKFIHAPWEMPPEIQKRTGCIIPDIYPAPIVDHKWARERTLDAYKTAKNKYTEHNVPEKHDF